MRNIPKDIILQASRGDMEAFETIYKAFSGFVYNVAYRTVDRKEDAEEVTQEVFLKIYRKLKDFLGKSSLKTWIYRITCNSAINYSKKMSRKGNKTVEYDDRLYSGEGSYTLNERIEKEYQEEKINNLLKVLNPDQRACIILKNIEGLSYQEIADTLHININTVRSRLKRARESLLALRREAVKDGL